MICSNSLQLFYDPTKSNVGARCAEILNSMLVTEETYLFELLSIYTCRNVVCVVSGLLFETIVVVLSIFALEKFPCV